MLGHVYETTNTFIDPLKAVKLLFVEKSNSLHWCTINAFQIFACTRYALVAKGLFYFTAWKCINLNFSHQNHYKLYVKAKIHSQTCSTNSTNGVQSCIDVYKLNMTRVMLDMDNWAPLPSLWLSALLGVCVQSRAWADGTDWGRKGALAHLTWQQNSAS